MKIYVASSWRNAFQHHVVSILRAEGHDVYDFREPESGVHGFSWSEIDPNWKTWTGKEFIDSLNHPLAKEGFGHDMRALEACHACVLVLPCGASAHLELGHAVGAGKITAVLFPDEQLVTAVNDEIHKGTIVLGQVSADRPMEYYTTTRHLNVEPELMYKMVNCVTDDLDEVVTYLERRNTTIGA